MKKASVIRVASLAQLATLATSEIDYRSYGAATIQAHKQQYQDINTNKAKNVILFIADGNGINTNYGTRLFEGQHQGGYGDDHELAAEKLPWNAFIKTYNTNAQTPDSAGTSCAMNTGYKTKSGLIGASADVIPYDCSTLAGNELPLFSTQVKEMKKKVGLVTTARVTHATPANVYAHSVWRGFESETTEGCTEQVDIAQQLILAMTDEDEPWVDFALGGGRQAFYNMTEDTYGDYGWRGDGKDLIVEAQDAGVQVVTTSEELLTLDVGDGSGKVLGLFEGSYMSYSHDRAEDVFSEEGTDEPTIMEMTKKAVEFLSKNEDGYYLLVEAGRVDTANHLGNLHRTFTDGVAFQEAVKWAIENTNHADTLLISTADHGHGVSMNGYCGRGSPITGLCYEVDPNGELHGEDPNYDDNGMPYTVVALANGPGSIIYQGGVNYGELDDEGFFVRQNLTNAEAMDPDHLQESTVPLYGDTHSGTDVALYARGPWSHLFTGTVEQTFVYDVMHYAVTNSE